MCRDSEILSISIPIFEGLRFNRKSVRPTEKLNERKRIRITLLMINANAMPTQKKFWGSEAGLVNLTYRVKMLESQR